MSRLFKFHIGEENAVIVEKGDYSNSLFIEQYRIALSLINNLVKNPQRSVPNLIAFCGDRGEGKTSCMLSVAYILANINDVKKQDLSALSIGRAEIENAGFEVLNLIDPAFFDKEHNLIELLLGNLYSGYKIWLKKHKGEGLYEKTSEVSRLFQKVRASILSLGKSQLDLYDPLEDLEALSAGVNLSSEMSQLMESYLSLVGKKRLLILVDDVDLNMSMAYRMCEEVRKYLNNEHCLVLMSVKIDQLTEAVESAMHHDADYPQSIDFSGMAAKYVAKLIPVSMRVEMPKAYDLCEYELNVYDKWDGELVYHSNAVKEGVVRRIFETSRFLFYNSKGAVSPIVPNNLRNLSHLLGLLFEMQNFDNAPIDTQMMNKHQFKAYFYKSWVKQLTHSNQVFVKKLIEGQNGSDTNKYVVNYLKDALDKVGACKGLIKDITEPSNYAYNVSVGDVLYIVSYLEKSSYDEELNRVLFFIKAYYSIILYERYDVVTEDITKKLYPNNDNNGLLYKADAWFDNTNELQRTVSGKFFTYNPNEILPPSGRGEKEQSRDYKVIRGKQNNKGLSVLLKLIGDCMPQYDDMGDDDKTQFEKRFRMAEYFMLTVVQSIYERDIKVTAKLDRTQSQPYYLTEFNQNTGFYVYDVLAIFASMTNFEYAYKRFKDLADIYDFAITHEWSLMRQMIATVRDKNIADNGEMPEEEKERRFPDYNQNKKNAVWKLYSNAIIRNSEVALAMMDNMRSKRNTVRDYASNAGLLSWFYKNIIKSNMMTYNRPENNQPYYINFEFLRPVVTLLQEDNINQETEITVNGERKSLPKFDDIYDYVPKYKEIVTDKMVSDLFVESLKNYRKMSRERVIGRIHDKQPQLYSAVSEDKWLEILSENKQYTREMLIDALRQYYNDFMNIEEGPHLGEAENGEVAGQENVNQDEQPEVNQE